MLHKKLFRTRDPSRTMEEMLLPLLPEQFGLRGIEMELDKIPGCVQMAVVAEWRHSS